jgi:hypothetical protein
VRLVTISALLAGCGGGSDLLLPSAGDPASVEITQGKEANGRVGEPLPQPMVVAVRDATGRPVEGAKVVFVLSEPKPGASVTPDTAVSNADGTASASITLGTTPGTQSGEVRALGTSGSATAAESFTLTALSENANGIAAVSGDNQSAPVNTALPQPLVVQVADAFGNPIAGVTVAWTIEGGGSVSETSTTTGDDGLTSVTRTLGGTAGEQRTLASVDGLAGSPVVFTQMATAGSASGVTIVSGNGQSGPVSTELPTALGVSVRDAGNNPVPNVAVTWVIGTGGGSVTPTTSTTDANGLATAAWTLGPAPGTNTLSAVVSGIGVAEFTATATAGAPARLQVATQPSSTAVSGVVLARQPVIQLLDASGNPARQPGVPVTVSIGSGAATLVGTATATTDADGRATFGGLALVGAGVVTTLRFTADGFAAVTSAQIALTAASTVTTITSDSPDPSDVGAQVTVQFTVSSNAGTPTGSVLVRDGSSGECTGTLSNGQGSCTITLSNSGNRTLTAEYQGADGFARSQDTEDHTVNAPPAPVLAVVRQPSSTATAGVVFDQQPAVQLRTSDGSDVPTGGVSVSAAIISGGGTLVGTTTRTTDASGRVEFIDLAITGAPGTRTLVFTASGFASVNSESIDVQAPPPASTTTAITSATPDPSTAGAAVTVSFTVSSPGGTPTGSVTVSDGTDSCTGDLSNGAGSCAIALTTVGTRTLTAAYTPSGADFAPSSATQEHQVDPAVSGIRAAGGASR